LLAVVHEQAEIGLPAAIDEARLVLIVLALLARGDRRALAEQAHEQQDVGEGALLGHDADVDEGVEVKQSHLDVLDAVFRKRRMLAGLGDALGADASVELVFDLQQVGVGLLPAFAVAHVQFLVKRVGVRIAVSSAWM